MNPFNTEYVTSALLSSQFGRILFLRCFPRLNRYPLIQLRPNHDFSGHILSHSQQANYIDSVTSQPAASDPSTT